MTEREIRERYPAARDEILRRGGPRISLAEYRHQVLEREAELRREHVLRAEVHRYGKDLRDLAGS